MIVVPTGRFRMGDLVNSGDTQEKPVHEVSVAAFAIARTEVTRAQWRAVMGYDPSHERECTDDCPVGMVSQGEAIDYLRQLSDRTGMRYRLPTEAEWEYACRAGGEHAYCGGNEPSDLGWFRENTPDLGNHNLQPVAGKRPNAFGLYDMLGNIMEWTLDCWNEDYEGAPTDGRAWLSGDCTQGVVRGGNSSFHVATMRSSFRGSVNRADRGVNLGFRPVQVLIENYRRLTPVGFAEVPVRWIEGAAVNLSCARSQLTCKALTNSGPVPLSEDERSHYGGNSGSRHCAELGGAEVTLLDRDNNEYSFCQFDDGSLGDGWELLRRYRLKHGIPH